LAVRRLNHAVLYVTDAQVSSRFYQDVLGLDVVSDHGGAVFLSVPGGDRHHDLGLFTTAGVSKPGPGRPGLYHLAWEVGSFEDLVAARDLLATHNALVGESDHGSSLSLYAQDPDGIEFEVMWATPQDTWDDTSPPTRGLDWTDATRRWGQASIDS
jgi:catechol-2,3-dioxygenase